ncbi:hypothetical protein CDAR_257911 [Caerostris darwini]|uniref:Uncharacterized protein n=1 Tax=Caerostris darwini TaxID=1538125 RepID=A0AAV4WXD8_9ARAC|nr:hypothetical protein CDAR_257911 [Caerostris darwini]
MGRANLSRSRVCRCNPLLQEAATKFVIDNFLGLLSCLSSHVYYLTVFLENLSQCYKPVNECKKITIQENWGKAGKQSTLKTSNLCNEVENASFFHKRLRTLVSSITLSKMSKRVSEKLHYLPVSFLLSSPLINFYPLPHPFL